VVFGRGKLIDPTKLARIYVSPRTRAQRTLEILLDSLPTSPAQSRTDADIDEGPEVNGTSNFDSDSSNSTSVSDKTRLLSLTKTTEQIAEWKYGDYEGLLPRELLALRKSRGLDTDPGKKWDIWESGVEGAEGESPEQVAARVDGVIEEICSVQGAWMRQQKSDGARKPANTDSNTSTPTNLQSTTPSNETPEQKEPSTKGCDVLVVAHGHILRAFVKRWLKMPMSFPAEMMLEPGGVCGLSYAHGNVGERAVLVGMSFPQG
jgi:probable phosphoglycerate mutase